MPAFPVVIDDIDILRLLTDDFNEESIYIPNKLLVYLYVNLHRLINNKSYIEPPILKYNSSLAEKFKRLVEQGAKEYKLNHSNRELILERNSPYELKDHRADKEFDWISIVDRPQYRKKLDEMNIQFVVGYRIPIYMTSLDLNSDDIKRVTNAINSSKVRIYEICLEKMELMDIIAISCGNIHREVIESEDNIQLEPTEYELQGKIYNNKEANLAIIQRKDISNINIEGETKFMKSNVKHTYHLNVPARGGWIYK